MIKSQMEQQLRLLKELDDLIVRSDAEGQTGTASAEDVDHLRTYVADMRRACNVAIALEAALTPPKEEKKAEPATEEKPAKRKSRAKKAEPKTEALPADVLVPEATEAEDDDLSFLD